MQWFNQRNLPMTLLVGGIILNAVDVLTAKGGGGGILFNDTDGFLRAVDGALPDMDVPGTSIRINLGGYLVLTGGIWLLIRELT